MDRDEKLTAVRGELERIQGDLSALRGSVVTAVDRIDQRCRELQKRLEPPRPAPAPQPESAPAPQPPPAAPPRPIKPAGSTEIQLGQRWLLIVGVVSIVCGIGYFLKYSFDQNWIGPGGRVALAYLAGAALLWLGDIFRRRGFAAFGLALNGGGIAALYASTFAAFQIYELLGQTAGFGIMVLVTLLAGALSLRYDHQWTAVLGLIGGFATPLLLSRGVDNQIGLMSYMVLLNAGILGLAAYKRWRLLNGLGFLFTWALFSGWYASFYSADKFWLSVFFLNVFFATYAVVPFTYYLTRVREERMASFGLTVPNAFIAFAFSWAMIEPYAGNSALSIVSVAYAGLYLLLAQLLYRRDARNARGLVVLLAQAVLFLIITVPVLCSGHWITVFWAVQATVLFWAALRLKHPRLLQAAWVLLLLTVGKFVFYDYPLLFAADAENWRFVRGFAYLLSDRLIAAVVVLGAVLQAAQLLRRAGAGSSAAAYVLFAVLLFGALNLEVGGFCYDYANAARFAARSVTWAVYAIALMAGGFYWGLPRMRQCALALFALTIIKVFLFDMQHVSTPFRILSFVVLGMVLVLASFLYYRFKDLVLAKDRKEEGQR